mmetsp:Transcript_73983/g.145198  ORF Transcript_73983/g.145198 Transcript_73983/m.145198 type:complete len:336 (-) Transcript_73983:40-1047(-)
MATVQQLEKLHQVQRLFYVEDSLESAVAGERVAQLIARTEQLLRQRAFLRDERRRLRIATDKIEERKKALEIISRPDWISEQLKTPDSEKHILINVGGLMFEAPVSVLRRDAKSLLSQLCDASPPILPDPDGGFFYFDRDWWLFRYVMTFMRDGTLPDDRALLSQLYREAVYWNLSSMQRAIEEERLHLRSALNKEDPKKEKPWWRKLPSWWQAVDEAKEKEKADAEAAKKKEDWWMDTTYKGKTYLEKDAKTDKPTTVTWSDPAAGISASGVHGYEPAYGYDGMSSLSRPAYAPYPPYSPNRSVQHSQQFRSPYASADLSAGGTGYLKPSSAWY